MALHLLVRRWPDERTRGVVTEVASLQSPSAGDAVYALWKGWPDEESRSVLFRAGQSGNSMANEILEDEGQRE